MGGRTREHVLETESERELRNVLPADWVIRDLTKGDYGIDGEVEVFEDGNPTGLTFRVQLKGTDSTKPTRSIPLSKFQYWGSFDVPVLLLLWQARSSELRGFWAHSHDPGRIPETQESTTVRFFPEHALKEWWEQIPDQLRLIRSIDRGTVKFPLPLQAHASSPAVVARLHAELREQLTVRDLEDVFIVQAGDQPAIRVSLDANTLRVALPLDLRSVTTHGARGAITRDPGLVTSTAVDILAMAALLISPIGTGEKASKVLAKTTTDSNLLRSDNGAELLGQVAATLCATGDVETLIKLIEFVADEPRLTSTGGEALLFIASTRTPMSERHARRLADVLRRRSKEVRKSDPGQSARYLFNAGQTLLHNHVWAEGIETLNEVESFSKHYAKEPDFFRARAQGHWWAGDLDASVKDYEAAWGLGMKTSGMVDSLSDALMTAGRYEDALAIASVEVDGTAPEERTVLRRVILRDVIATTGLKEQKRVPLSEGLCRDLSEAGDPEAIRKVLVEMDALAPTLLVDLAKLEDVSPTGGTILLAVWNEKIASLWVLAIVTAFVRNEATELIEALARAGSTATNEFLQEFSEMIEETPKECPDHDWAEVERLVYAASAATNPFRKGGLRLLNLPD